jgi:hypothetical protein
MSDHDEEILVPAGDVATLTMPSEECTVAELKVDFEKWVETIDIRLRETALKYPAYQCYKTAQTPPRHYWLVEYEMPKDGVSPATVMILHGADSTLPGVGTFGQDPAQLIPCACGKWTAATPEQVAATRQLVALRAARMTEH